MKSPLYIGMTRIEFQVIPFYSFYSSVFSTYTNCVYILYTYKETGWNHLSIQEWHGLSSKLFPSTHSTHQSSIYWYYYTYRWHGLSSKLIASTHSSTHSIILCMYMEKPDGITSLLLQFIYTDDTDRVPSQSPLPILPFFYINIICIYRETGWNHLYVDNTDWVPSYSFLPMA